MPVAEVSFSRTKLYYDLIRTECKLCGTVLITMVTKVDEIESEHLHECEGSDSLQFGR